ncbi:periostin-like isoform X2 [Rhodnius prolixus]
MVKPLKNVLETAKELGARKFAKLIEQSGVRNQFVREGAITLFAPHDDAMKSIEPSLEQSMVPFSSNLNNLINYHTMDNRLKSSLFEADMMINTKYEGYKLRLNKFSSWINTVNCKRIVNKDNEATNGIVHIINSVLNPEDAPQRNIADILLQDGRFNIFSQAMENTGTSRMLRKSKSPVTVLAPTDEAFKYMKRSTLQRILNDDKAGEALIKNHILPHTLCSAAVIGQHKLKTESKDKVIIECNENGIILDNTTSLDEFLSGENGVIYVTNRVMLPDKAKCLTKLMEGLQLNTFLKLVKFARVDETFDESGDYTVFVPTEDAMSGVQKEKLNELFQDRNKAKQFVLHHTIQGKLKVQEISDHQVARSLDEENSVRFHINRKYLGIDGAIIEKENIEGRNGILHVISKPLVAINKGWDEVLQQNSSYSTFMDAIRKTPLRNDLRANLFKTIFVPTNQAFKNLGQSYVDQLMENATYLTEILQNHFLIDFITKESLQNGMYYNFPTSSGFIEIFKENDVLTVENALVISSDILTRNGVMHIINEVLHKKNR